MNKKHWYQSKTIWVNGLFLIALIIQTQTGFIISSEEQLAVITLVNLILRIFTKQPLIG